MLHPSVVACSLLSNVINHILAGRSVSCCIPMYSIVQKDAASLQEVPKGHGVFPKTGVTQAKAAKKRELDSKKDDPSTTKDPKKPKSFVHHPLVRSTSSVSFPPRSQIHTHPHPRPEYVRSPSFPLSQDRKVHIWHMMLQCPQMSLCAAPAIIALILCAFCTVLGPHLTKADIAAMTPSASALAQWNTEVGNLLNLEIHDITANLSVAHASADAGNHLGEHLCVAVSHPKQRRVLPGDEGPSRLRPEPTYSLVDAGE